MTALPNEQTNDARQSLASKILFTVGVILLSLLALFAYPAGLLSNVLFSLLFLLVPITVLSRLWNVYRKQIAFRFLRSPFRPEMRWHLLQFFNRCLFLAAILVIFHLAVVPPQFTPEQYHSTQMIAFASVAVLLFLECFPARRLHLSTNLFFAGIWLFLGWQFLQIMSPPARSETVVLDAPFAGDWYVFQGGRSALINHHYALSSQRNALDLCKIENGQFAQGDAKRLESYAAFGANLFAPAEGKIVEAVDGRPDMPIGKMDREQIVGNHLVIEIAPERFVVMAHLQKGSLRAARGDQVHRGQIVARCGNSGNTSQPHLHLQVQNQADLFASGAKTFPILFRDVVRMRDGISQQFSAADVRRNDHLLVPEAAPKS